MANNKNKKKSTYVGAKKNEPQYVCPLTDLSGQDGFTRTVPETGRWSYGLSVFTSGFSKNVLLNIILLVFMIPLIVLIVRAVSNIVAATYAAPFGANMLLGFMPVGNMTGLKEGLVASGLNEFFLFLPIALIVFGVGLAGGTYCVRNAVWGYDAPLFSSLFKGIKRNWFNVFILSAFYSLFISGAGIGVTSITYAEATGGAAWYLTVIKVCAIVLAAFLTLWYFAAVTFNASYGSSFYQLLRNSFKITLFLLPLNVLYAVIALAPFALFLAGQSFMTLAIMLVALFGVSFFLIVWTTYSQWVYERFINPSVTRKYEPTEKEIEDGKKKLEKKEEQDSANGYVSVAETRGARAEEKKERLVVQPVTESKTVTFSEDFTRADIAALEERKKALSEQAKNYAAKSKK